jgi:hypothetical protein
MRVRPEGAIYISPMATPWVVSMKNENVRPERATYISSLLRQVVGWKPTDPTPSSKYLKICFVKLT